MLSTTHLDATATAAALEAGVRRRREAEVEDLLLVLHWADLHSYDPHLDREREARARHDRGAPRPIPGADRLRPLGGEGTPEVLELALCELGVAREVHTHSARTITADALDLRHRLPATFAHVVALDAELWVARKVAVLTRDLSPDQAGEVDRAVADVITGHSPSRVLAVAEAAVIEADLAAHRERVAFELARRYVGASRTTPEGLRTVYAKITAGDAQGVLDLVERLTDALADRPDLAERTRDEVRAEAFATLARPDDVQALLETADPAETAETAETAERTKRRRQAVLYIHLHQAVLDGLASGVARVEGLGPHTLAQLQRLLVHDRVVVKPVIDLAEQVSTLAYEHPEAVKERLHLAHPGDAFPHASSTTRNLDLDHVRSYDHHPPPGAPPQTGTHTSRPLGRTGHRAKTHLGYRVVLLHDGAALWTTPHGRTRLVDHTGTVTLTPDEAAAHTSESVGERRLVRELHRRRPATID